MNREGVLAWSGVYAASIRENDGSFCIGRDLYMQMQQIPVITPDGAYLAKRRPINRLRMTQAAVGMGCDGNLFILHRDSADAIKKPTHHSP